MINIKEKLTEIEAIDEKISEFLNKKKSIQDEIDAMVISKAHDELAAKPYGCGTVNLEIDGVKTKVVVRKTVKWDEDYLKRFIEPMIEEAGRDPEEYIKYKRSVSENSYKNFNDDMKKIFEPARTVHPSKPTISYEV